MFEDAYRIFVNLELLNDIDWEDKTDVIEKITLFFKKIINYYNLDMEGFYKISVYPSSVGVIMDVDLIDDYSYNDNNLDFRIVVYLNKKIYFKTACFDAVSKFSEIFYDDEFFYVDLDKFSGKFINYCEFGDIVINSNPNLRTLKKD